MAEKEATVYIVDVGRSMGECHHGRSVTDLEWAMRYVWDKITHTVRAFQIVDSFNITHQILGRHCPENGNFICPCFAFQW